MLDFNTMHYTTLAKVKLLEIFLTIINHYTDFNPGIEGVFCYNRYCLNDCTPSISFHCSNDQVKNLLLHVFELYLKIFVIIETK